MIVNWSIYIDIVPSEILWQRVKRIYLRFITKIREYICSIVTNRIVRIVQNLTPICADISVILFRFKVYVTYVSFYKRRITTLLSRVLKFTDLFPRRSSAEFARNDRFRERNSSFPGYIEIYRSKREIMAIETERERERENIYNWLAWSRRRKTRLFPPLVDRYILFGGEGGGGEYPVAPINPDSHSVRFCCDRSSLNRTSNAWTVGRVW